MRRILVPFFAMFALVAVLFLGGAKSDTDAFDTARHAFLIDDSGFFLPSILDDNERRHAREKLNGIYARSDLTLGIARTTALFYESGSDTDWLFKYDEAGNSLIAFERAYAIGFYDQGSAFAGEGLFRLACVDPDSPLFRFIVSQNDWTNMVIAAHRKHCTFLGSVGRCNIAEADRAMRIVSRGHPLPLALVSRDFSERRAVLAIAVELHGFEKSKTKPVVLAVYDPKSPYVRPADGAKGLTAVGTIAVATDGTLSMNIAGVDPNEYPLLITDPAYDPDSTAFTDMVNASLEKHNAALKGG